VLAGEIGRDFLPGVAVVGALKEDVGGVVEAMGIDGRKEDGLGAIAVDAGVAQRNGSEVLRLPGDHVEA
jgi:hypothetical protein